MRLASLAAGVAKVVFALVALAAFGALVDLLMRNRPMPEPVAGSALLLLGVVVEVLATRALWKTGGGTPNPTHPTASLVASGPYAWSRNPLYLGRLAMLAGLALVEGSLGTLATAVALALALQLVLVPREEARLRARFGAAYEAYAHRTRRWFGRRA
ncbi:MAG: methyltransferase family protein [Thermoplasmatota archaeon]